MAKLMHWKPGMAEAMYDSVRYTQYHKAIAQRMLPYLRPEDRLCDGACGVGGIALALAPYVHSVYAIDQAQPAIDCLRRTLQRLKIEHVTAVAGDLFAMPRDLRFDAMEFMQFGSLEEILTLAQRHCDGRIFVISRNRKAHRFGRNAQVPLGFSYEIMSSQLEQLSIPFEGQRFTLQMGQPFRTLEEAKAFLCRYNDGEEPDSGQLACLVPAESEEFRWFLPALTELGMLVFRAADIPEDWRQRLEMPQCATE